MASLYTLPNELLLNVAKYLDQPDLLKLALTCRKFASIAEDVLYDRLVIKPARGLISA
jgi:hypothetical protein